MSCLVKPTPKGAAPAQPEIKSAHSQMHGDRLAYRPDIDGLRALAVLAVVFCHATLGAPGGFVGVDVFFVISGFLIASLLLKDLRRGAFSLAEFWERRARRILPALFVVSLTSLGVGWLLLMPAQYAALGKSVAAIALLAANVHFWRDTGYFHPDAQEKPMLHTWSLAVEEQFYLIIPIVLWLLTLRGRWQRANALLGAALLGSLLLSVVGTHFFQRSTFYLLPTRAWELLVGVGLAWFPIERLTPPWLRSDWVAGIGLASIVTPWFIYDDSTRFPGMAALPPVVGTALLIWTGTTADGALPLVNRCLAWRPLVSVGLISYSLYLWHWPVFAFARCLTIYPLTVLERVSLVLLSLVLAIVSWRCVEVPFRGRGIIRTRGWLVAMSSAALAVMFAGGSAVYFADGIERRVPRDARQFAAASRVERRYTRNIDETDIPNRLITLGRGGGPVELLVWGDSHAMAVLPAIDAVCNEQGVTCRAATHTATAPVLDYFKRAQYGLRERSIPFNAAVLSYVRNTPIRTVLLVAHWEAYFRDDGFSDALLNTVVALQSLGVDVYVMSDVPEFEYDVPKALCLYCMQGNDLRTLGLPLEQYAAANRRFLEFAPELVRRGVTILDPIPIMRSRTNGAEFMPYDTGGSYYRDSHHLSTYGALSIRELFFPAVRRGVAAQHHY